MEPESELKTENVPQLRKAGRRRERPQHDFKALAEQQARQLSQQQDQIERLMSLFTSGNVGKENPLSAFLPPKPLPIPRPEGFRYELRRDGDQFDNDTHYVDVPAREDNPNEPDPRYCPFCMVQQDLRPNQDTYAIKLKRANIPARYGHKISGKPTAEEMEIINQCFILHQQDAVAKQGLKGAKFKNERRFAADHLELIATKWGRVPDVVAYYDDREWSSEEWYQRELLEWEAKTRRIGMGMAQGGA